MSLIARTHVKYSIRGGAGLIFVLISLVAGLGMASMVIDPVDGIKSVAEAEGGEDVDSTAILNDVVERIGVPMVKRFTDGDDDQANYLVLEKPALVSAFIVMLMFFWPLMVSLGAFNQTSGDIGNRGLRYQLLRTERANIFIGRLLGTFLFTMVVLAVLIGTVMLFLIAKAKFYPTGDVVLWMLHAFVMVAIYSLPWIAVCAWLSATIDSPFGALVLSLLLIVFPPILFSLGSGAHEMVADGRYITPWGYKWWLVHPDLLKVAGGIAVMVASAALFTWLGLRHFQKRDL